MNTEFVRYFFSIFQTGSLACSGKGRCRDEFDGVAIACENPTPPEVVAEMLRMADVKSGDVVYDLGCGDGRIVITAAREYGARGVGIDINPVRIRESQENARLAGVADRVQFRTDDLFKTDLSEATVVTLYLLPSINQKLRPKLFRELKAGTRIVSHSFDMGDWKPDRVSKIKNYGGGERTIYFWTIPAQARK